MKYFFRKNVLTRFIESPPRTVFVVMPKPNWYGKAITALPFQKTITQGFASAYKKYMIHDSARDNERGARQTYFFVGGGKHAKQNRRHKSPSRPNNRLNVAPAK